MKETAVTRVKGVTAVSHLGSCPEPMAPAARAQLSAAVNISPLRPAAAMIGSM
jgi:hypothetical protein